MKRSHSISYMERRARKGYLFMLPLFFGLALVFIPSLVRTVIFSFNEITIGSFGYKLTFQGWQYYQTALTKDPQIVPDMIVSLRTLLINIPIILIFSLFIATLLNQRFRGRLIARMIFFLPVILTTGVLVRFDAPAMNLVAQTVDTGSDSSLALVGGLSSMLASLNFSDTLTGIISSAVSNIYSVVTASGIQIFIFLAGLQEIPQSLYEAAAVEGCNKWELFWKITFPMIMPQMTINAVYTIVDSFTDPSGIFTYISELGTQQQYSLATAASILYLICLGVVIAVVMAIIRAYRKHSI